MILEQFKKFLDELDSLSVDDQVHMQNQMRAMLYEKYPKQDIDYPCLRVILVPSEKVVANAYNPNKVAIPEMKLLQHSIEEDGLTMAIVTCYDPERDVYEIVDGFHRDDIVANKLKQKYVPIVTIDKDIKDRMASTVRHNRARGVHKVDLQAEMVVDLLRKGWRDEDISKHLGMSFEEVLRLKQVTGVKEIFKNRDYSRSWIAPENEILEDELDIQ